MNRFHRAINLALSLCSALATPLAAEHAARPQVPLDGTWEFRMDPRNEGEAEKWFDAGVAYPNKIQVPGNWQAQGFGEPLRLVRHNYQGIAWYRRALAVPKDWAGKRIWLRFQSVINNGEVYVNGRKVGRIESFVTPYEFDVTDSVRPGADNVLAVRVDSGSTDEIARNNFNLGDANSANGYVGMIQYFAKWGGIIGRVELQARPGLSIEEVVIRADVAKRVANVFFQLNRREAGKPWEGKATVEIAPVTGSAKTWKGEVPVRLAPEATQSGPAHLAVAMPDMHFWSPEDPFLYQVRVAISDGSGRVDEVDVRTGLREFDVTGGNGAFVLNGQPCFLRGVGYDSIEPITGTPMPDKNIYVERLRHLKDLGFNCVRMLAHTPIKEFFDAADEVGMLVQGDGEFFLGFATPMNEQTADLLSAQVPRLIREHRNHPSWYAFSCMNEGGYMNAADAAAKSRYVQSAYQTFREMDPTRYFLASDGSSWWPTDILSNRGDWAKADESPPAVAPTQVFNGELDGFAYFRRALPDAEMAALAAAAPGRPDAATATDTLKPDGHWQGAAIAKGADLADQAPAILAKEGAPFSAGIWMKPAAFAPGDFGTPFSFGAAETGQGLLVSLDGYAGNGQIAIGRYNQNILTSKAALSPNVWNHLGVSFDGAKLRLFINGKPDSEIAGNLAVAPKDLKLGSLISRPQHSADDYRNRPHIWHEFNQTYIGPLPDLDKEKKLTRAAISQEANLLARHRARIASFGLLDRYAALRQTSFGAYYEYLKQAFEAARQMPNLDGYHWWVVSDIPAGFECDVTDYGILDMVYQPEKFLHTDSLLPFNSASVLLIDADVDKRVLADDERKVIGLSVSHYGTHPIKDGLLSWQLTHSGQTLRQGKISGVTANNGQITKIGNIELDPLLTTSAREMVLNVQLQSKAGTQTNSWKFWVFPRQKQDFVGSSIANLTGVKTLDVRYAAENKAAGSRLCLADKMTPELLEYVENGGRIILLEQDEAASARSRQVTGSHVDKPAQNASRIMNESAGLPFWPRWIRANVNIIENHPALRDFPHGDRPDYQLGRLFGTNVNAVDFSNADSAQRRKMRPLVWGLNLEDAQTPVPNFPAPQEFFYGSMISEAWLGKGQVIICSLWALDGIKRGYPEAGYLLDCLVDYMLKNKPAPGDLPALTDEEARKLFKIK